MRKEEVEHTPNMTTSKSFIRTHLVKVLFNSGAMHSSISTRLMKTLELAPTSKHALLHIALPNGKVVNCQELIIDCPIKIHGHEFLADLYKFKLTKFDAILDID